MLKNYCKKLLVAILGWQVRQLVRKNAELKVVAVVGSVGKTSTKHAIAHTLSRRYRVQWQAGNYNDILSVPLVIFGHTIPKLWNIFAWTYILLNNQYQLGRDYNYDVIVVELGTDHPGDIATFSKYLRPDFTVIASVAPEHMEFFHDLDAVAKEELSVIDFSQEILASYSDIDTKYLPSGDNISSYGLSKNVDSSAAVGPIDDHMNRQILINLKDQEPFTVQLKSPAKNAVKSALAAAVVAHWCGMDVSEIKQALESLQPTAGRLQILRGKKSSWLLDDTYNASPVAVEAALTLLYELKAEHKIAILGSMNELGDYSKDAHQYIGKLCDPNQLDLVVTIGHDAYKYLASIAEKAGCKVQRFLDPVSAGHFVLDNLESDSLVLAKGSQNGVFAEEALKPLLADKSDADKLVRQSKSWLKTKRKQFPDVR